MRQSTILMSLIMTVCTFAGCQSAGNTNAISQPANNTAANKTVNTTAAAPVNAATPAASTDAPASSLKPEDVNPDKPVPAAELNKAFFADQAAWKGKTVSITGNYHSHTTSTVSSGKIIRIDIADQTGKKAAACTVAKEPTAEEVKERNNRTFKGTVKEAWFSQVLLEPCEMTK